MSGLQQYAPLMRYGVELPNFGLHGEPDELVELAVTAEQAGWDGVFVWDALGVDVGEQNPAYLRGCDPWISLAAMAAATARVTIGTMVTPPARRRPWKLARETVTLDRLSHGRLALPVALGWVPDPGFSGVGEPTERRVRAERLDEALDILAGLWSGEPLSYQGRHYHVEGLKFLPTPVQTPRIPVWVVAAWPRPRSLARAYRWDGVIPARPEAANEGYATAGGCSPADIAALVADGAVHRGGTPLEIVLGGATPGDQLTKAAEIVGPYAEAGGTWWIEASVWQAMWANPGDIRPLRRRIDQGPPRR
jgi:alkanesulfonate monooxygenase SsuD/methylene tetrahydromethanopterin reductase-like flavin-dependent oxidoreductase (luciferase family)